MGNKTELAATACATILRVLAAGHCARMGCLAEKNGLYLAP
jgi:hypothetical protein